MSDTTTIIDDENKPINQAKNKNLSQNTDLHNKILNNRYKLLELLGKGGMGVVYKAEDLQTKQLVAIKLLSNNIAHYDLALSAFREEAKKELAFKHPNIVSCFAFHETDYIYKVMEYIPSQNLKQWVEGQVINIHKTPSREYLNKTIYIMLQVCNAIHYIHNQHIIHCDLKPSNIFIDHCSLNIKLFDFGIAQYASTNANQTNTSTNTGTHSNSKFTAYTEKYASIEMLSNKQTQTQDDIYGLGCIFYFLLSQGDHPYQGLSLLQVQAENQSISPLPYLNSRLNILLKQMLTPSQAQRCDSVAYIESELKACINNPTAYNQASSRKAPNIIDKIKKKITTIQFRYLILGSISALAVFIGLTIILIHIFSGPAVPQVSAKTLPHKVIIPSCLKLSQSNTKGYGLACTLDALNNHILKMRWFNDGKKHKFALMQSPLTNAEVLAMTKKLGIDEQFSIQKDKLKAWFHPSSLEQIDLLNYTVTDVMGNGTTIAQSAQLTYGMDQLRNCNLTDNKSHWKSPQSHIVFSTVLNNMELALNSNAQEQTAFINISKLASSACVENIGTDTNTVISPNAIVRLAWKAL